MRERATMNAKSSTWSILVIHKTSRWMEGDWGGNQKERRRGNRWINQVRAYSSVLDGSVQLMHFDGQGLVLVQGQSQSFDFGPRFDAGIQLAKETSGNYSLIEQTNQFNYNYVGEFESASRLDGSQTGSSLSGVLDQRDGVIPHGVGHAVDVLAESQTVLVVRFKVARLFANNYHNYYQVVLSSFHHPKDDAAPIISLA